MKHDPASGRFGAPWGTPLKVISLLSVMLLLGIGFIALFVQRSRTIPLMLATAIPPLLLLCSALFTIRGYQIEQGMLQVQRLLWKTRISLDGLQTATHRPKAMQGSIRLFGNGGLFSFSGLYTNKELGRYRAFVTDLNRCVVLKFAAKTIVVSPESPEEFVQRISAVALRTDPRDSSASRQVRA